jgi:hypothetical protein
LGGVEARISEVAEFTALIKAGLAGPVEPLGLTCVPRDTFKVFPAGVRNTADPVARPKPLRPANPEVPRIPAVPTGVPISKFDPLFCFATLKKISPSGTEILVTEALGDCSTAL